MALPKIDRPIFETELPSGTTLKFTPFRVKEEKLLLIARESEDGKDMVQAVRQVIQNCTVDESIQVEKLPSFDLEYLFVQIRSKSVGEIAKLYYQHRNGTNSKDEECDHVQEVEVNLNKIEVIKEPNHSQTMELNETYGIKMIYPTLEMLDSVGEKDPIEALVELISLCIESVYTDDEVFEPENVAEAKEFLEALGQKELNILENFFTTMPKNTLEVKYECEKCKDEETFKLENLSDFF